MRPCIRRGRIQYPRQREPRPLSPPVVVGAPIGLFLNNGTDQIFGGEILTRDQYAEFDQPLNVRLDLTCTDYTRLLNRRKVEKDYGTASATAIVLDLIANFAPGIGVGAVEAGLPSVDGGITFTFEDVGRALSRIAEKIGAYWYVDYVATLHFFTGTEAGPTPDPLVPGGRFSDLKISADLSQVRTRVIVEGDGGTVALSLPAGDAILPVSQTTRSIPRAGSRSSAPGASHTPGSSPGARKRIPRARRRADRPQGRPGAPRGADGDAGGRRSAGALAGGPVLRDDGRACRRVALVPGGASRPVTITAADAPPYVGPVLGRPRRKGPWRSGFSRFTRRPTSTRTAARRPRRSGAARSRRSSVAPSSPANQFPRRGRRRGTMATGYYDYAVTFLTPAETTQDLRGTRSLLARRGYGSPTDRP